MKGETAMTIKYVETVCAVIEYDGKFVDHTFEDQIKFIDFLVETAQKEMNEYGFKTALIKNAESYDTIVSITSDWQDNFESDDEEEEEL